MLEIPRKQQNVYKKNKKLIKSSTFKLNVVTYPQFDTKGFLNIHE